ncbi:MAG TPA: cytochrome c [Terriglobales bacterium]|nr:cytochrome c [Terriglobales bacterium]
MRNFILGVIVVIVVIVAGGLVYTLGGFVDTNAGQSPGPAETWLASHAMDASMEKHASHVQSPIPATDANLIDGMKFYTMNCAQCHGTVTKKPSDLGQALYPPAPQLILQPLDDPEWHIFFAIKHGVRWTGMAAWGKTTTDENIWKTTMFLSRVNQLPPAVKQAIGQ